MINDCVMHDRLVIIGASGHGKVIADIATQKRSYKEIVFLDDNEILVECMGFPVVGKCSDARQYIKNSDMVVAIGNAHIRKKIMSSLLGAGAEMPVLIHPSAIIGDNVTIDTGTVVMAGSVINPDSKIGKGCIVNTCASVDHDCQISDYVHIAVGAHVAGTVTIGEECWVGAGAIVKNNLKICSGCMIGAGAVVVKNIDEIGTYVGVPARKIKLDKF